MSRFQTIVNREGYVKGDSVVGQQVYITTDPTDKEPGFVYQSEEQLALLAKKPKKGEAAIQEPIPISSADSEEAIDAQIKALQDRKKSMKQSAAQQAASSQAEKKAPAPAGS